ncbi:PIN-like domain-containing protein [Mesorhizobium sp.]|uniref:PIN-like domain-containing protein n=1 Tax=Mesorhizobium sp. TaxID=1871066 RepID=UPI00338D7B8F
MRKLFHGYYEPTEKEFEKIWSDGLLVPDTNVLLHLFRFMPERRAEILAAFKSFGDRLWLPYQVASEFHAGWRSADSGNRAAYAKAERGTCKETIGSRNGDRRPQSIRSLAEGIVDGRHRKVF